MIDKNIFIKSFDDFRDIEKYSLKQLAEFISNNSITKDFYQKKVNKINKYIKKYPELIINKYSEDKHCFEAKNKNYYKCSYEYTKEEINIINEIIKEHLITFWVLNQELQHKIDILNLNEKELRLVLGVYNSDETERQNLIDYIKYFCIIPYSENQVPDIVLTETEKIVLKYIHNGLSVPQIAQEMTCSSNTIENHKKNICKKIDTLNFEEYANKKALAKLYILAQKLFN